MYNKNHTCLLKYTASDHHETQILLNQTYQRQIKMLKFDQQKIVNPNKTHSLHFILSQNNI